MPESGGLARPFRLKCPISGPNVAKYRSIRGGPGSEGATMTESRGNAVGWFEIYVQDMDRAKRFYEGVFGVQLQQLDSPGLEMWAFPGAMDRYGAPGALVRLEGCASGGNSTLVYFSCADCAVESERAASRGGQIHRAKFSIGQYGFIALIVDPDGNMFGLHSMA
jgi:predicted enzyme related to lactoylglutathione lyase